MSRPSFQFYPGDWRKNANLGRCSKAARGAWVDVLCVLHDSDEYGVARYPLKELANASGCLVVLLRELVDKGVLKGTDNGTVDAFVYVPRSGRKDGAPVTLLPVQTGPIWYSSRMVKDEYVNTHRGEGTRFGDGKGEAPKPTPKAAPEPSPTRREGDGPSSSSSPSGKKKSPSKSALPDGFAISERVRAWAADKGHRNLDAQFEEFVSYARRSGAKYADWDEALMTAIRKDWAEVGAPSGGAPWDGAR